MHKYSDELIQRTIVHFRTKYNHIIDEEKANEYLDSFASLFESFIDFTENNMFNYSEKLIQETIDCFKDEDNLNISKETANEYLESLGGLFLAFKKEK